MVVSKVRRNNIDKFDVKTYTRRIFKFRNEELEALNEYCHEYGLTVNGFV